MSAIDCVRCIVHKIVVFSNKYPVSRGMVSYAIIWPVGSLVQQTIEGKNEYDFVRAGKFLLYGSCYVAPTLNLWMKIARYIWPSPNLKSALTKALVEQVTYTPFAISSFYFGMTLLEGKTINEAKTEVEEKFFPTFKVAVCVWPVLQTVNYTLIPEKNRVPFVSVCSLVWSSFLAFMKYLEGKHFKEVQPVPMAHERKR